jgi:hypothetical protein
MSESETVYLKFQNLVQTRPCLRCGRIRRNQPREDVINTAPMMALALKQAVRNRAMEKVKSLGIPEWNDAFVRIAMQDEKGPLFIATPDSTGLDDLAEGVFRAAPDDLSRLGFAGTQSMRMRRR